MDIAEYIHDRHTERFAPGAKGPVGAVLMSTQMKRSYPDASFRWTSEVSGQNEKYFGSNIQDGQYASFTSGGGGARTLVKPFKKSLVTGSRWTNLTVPDDKLIMPVQGEIHDLDWAGKLAFNYSAQRTGNKYGGVNGFQMRPGGIPVGVMPRVTQLDNSASSNDEQIVNAPPAASAAEGNSKGFMRK